MLYPVYWGPALNAVEMSVLLWTHLTGESHAAWCVWRTNLGEISDPNSVTEDSGQKGFFHVEKHLNMLFWGTEIRFYDFNQCQSSNFKYLGRNFNKWGDMRTDFSTALKNTKLLLSFQKPLEVSKRGTTPVSNCTMADLVYLSHCGRSHSDMTSRLFPVACLPNTVSGVRWYPVLLKGKNTNGREKTRWKNSFRGTILKNSDALR